MYQFCKILIETQEDDGPASATASAEQLSVRERMQRFNKMASETDLQGRVNGSTTPTKKRSDKVIIPTY